MEKSVSVFQKQEQLLGESLITYEFFKIFDSKWKQFKTVKEYKETNGDTIKHISFKELGIEFSFLNDKLNCIFFYGLFENNFKEFNQTQCQINLPYEIEIKSVTGEELIYRFGEPNFKSKNQLGTTPIFMTYQHLGLDIYLNCSNWSLAPKAKIQFICLFQKEIKDNEIKCGVCQKDNAQFKCSQCLMVWYCGKDCQKRHWPWHKKFCKQIQ